MAIKLTKPILLKAIGIKANNHVFPTHLKFKLKKKKKHHVYPNTYQVLVGQTDVLLHNNCDLKVTDFTVPITES